MYFNNSSWSELEWKEAELMVMIRKWHQKFPSPFTTKKILNHILTPLIIDNTNACLVCFIGMHTWASDHQKSIIPATKTLMTSMPIMHLTLLEVCGVPVTNTHIYHHVQLQMVYAPDQFSSTAPINCFLSYRFSENKMELS